MKKDFTNKTEKELQVLLNEKGLALRAFRFNVAGSNVRNVKEGRTLRKDIARIKTIFSATKKGIVVPAKKVVKLPAKQPLKASGSGHTTIAQSSTSHRMTTKTAKAK
jgi:ribosomal protein L29